MLPPKSPRGTSYSNAESPGLQLPDSKQTVNQSVGRANIQQGFHHRNVRTVKWSNSCPDRPSSPILAAFKIIMANWRETGDGINVSTEENEGVLLVSCWPVIVLYSQVQAGSKVPSFLLPASPSMPSFIPSCLDGGLSLAVTLASVRGLLAVVKELPSVPF